MDLQTRRKVVAILKVLHENGQPLGSSAISAQLPNWGVELRERMVRYYLGLTDQEGFTRNLGRRGRVLTDKGRRELEVGVTIDKVGFIGARVDELTYRMNFNENQKDGTVIWNLSSIATVDFDRAKQAIGDVIQAGLSMGRLARVITPDHRLPGVDVPQGRVAVASACSMTLNGVLLRHGIIMTSRFGGLLEISQGQPVRFSHVINYDATTIDPIEMFIRGHMTNIRGIIDNQTGTMGASFREIPTIALDDFNRICQRLEEIGLGGVMMVGKPNQPLLDIPVSYGRVGVIVAAGLNPMASVEEMGIETKNIALHSLCDFSLLREWENIDDETDLSGNAS